MISFGIFYLNAILFTICMCFDFCMNIVPLSNSVMDNSNCDNPRATENIHSSDDIDLNDLLRTFHDDPNNEVKSFTCSPYIEIDSLTPVLSRYKANFYVLSLNIQSINSKFDALLAILSELNVNDIKIDAICLQETWLSTEQDASIFNIPGYHLINLGKKCSAHSGLAIYLSDSFSYLIKSVHEDSELWDGLFIEVSGESFCEKIIIVNIYRPPRSNNNNKTIKQFCEELTPVISDISKNSCHIIITGDFNIDLLQINERSEFQKYFDLFVTHGLFPNITVPTRCCKSSCPVIDQMFCKLKETSFIFLCDQDLHIRSFSLYISLWYFEKKQNIHQHLSKLIVQTRLPLRLFTAK